MRIVTTLHCTTRSSINVTIVPIIKPFNYQYQQRVSQSPLDTANLAKYIALLDPQ